LDPIHQVFYFFTALHSINLMHMDSTTLFRWASALVLQAVVLAGKTDAGSGFFDEIPYWVCLHQEMQKTQLHKREILFTEAGDDQNKMGVTGWELKVRMTLSLIVNAFYRTLIIITLPASLASCTAPMDFVSTVLV
jgi:hypothetical protein